MADFNTFEHMADIGIIGHGKTQAEAFQNAAKAMVNVMVNIEKVETKQTIEVKCEAENVEELLVEWLNELIAQMGLEGLVFSEFKVDIKEENGFKLTGTAKGEPLNKLKHEIKIEVKAATYSNLKVAKDNDGKWFAQCVVDV